MVTIEYEVNADDLEAFVQLMQELGRSRKRDGAFIWGVMERADQANRFLEYFMFESWLEHLRQHERVTNTDKLLQERLQQLLVAGRSPHINHYLAPGRSE